MDIGTSWTEVAPASANAESVTIQNDPDSTANINVRLKGKTEYIVLEAGASAEIDWPECRGGVEAQSTSGTQTAHVIDRVNGS